MAKYVTYVDFADIEKIQIYQANGKYTAAQLRSRIGCDYIINGGLYTMATMKPNCKLKVDGKQVVSDPYGYVGPAWNNPPKSAAEFPFITLPAGNQLGALPYDNAISSISAFRFDNKVGQAALDGVQNNSAIGYSTSRTAIGKKDGKLALFLSSTAMRPKAMNDYLVSLGWSDIMMLDGGGSTQGYLGSGKQVTSSRKVQNYICVFLKRKSSSGTTGSSTNESSGSGGLVVEHPDYSKANPYPVPTRAVKYGMKGEDVKWVQFQLNKHNIVCDVDGSCGPACLQAIKDFQKSHGLSVDGSCGPDTRNTLKKDHDTECSQQYITAKNPYPKPTRAIKYCLKGEDVKWVQYQLNVHGYAVEIDGSCGPASTAAIKEFQSDHGLEVDGSCGPATRAELSK